MLNRTNIQPENNFKKMLSYFGYGYNTLHEIREKKKISNSWDEEGKMLKKKATTDESYRKTDSKLKNRLNEMYFSGIKHTSFKIDERIPDKIFENYKKEALSHKYIFMWEEKKLNDYSDYGNNVIGNNSSFTYELYLSPKRILEYGEPSWLFV